MNDVIEMLAAVSPDLEDESVPPIEDVWRKLDVITEGRAATPRALRGSARGRRRGQTALHVRSTTLPTVVVSVAAAIALCGSALAAADGFGIVDFGGGVSAPTAAYLQTFSVWQRPATSHDVLPGDPGDGGFTHVRLVSTPSDPTSQWIAVSADGQLCVILSDKPFGASALPSACIAASSIDDGSELLIGGAYAGSGTGPLTTDPSVGSGSMQIFGGVAPDGISQVKVLFDDGSTQTVAVTNNGFQFESSSVPSQFTWTSADGTQHVQGRGNNG